MGSFATFYVPTMKTSRLVGFPGWSEYLLVTQVMLLVLSRIRLNFVLIEILTN